MAVFFLFGMIFIASYAFWFLSPQVEMTEAEKAKADRDAFNAELRRRHGERSRLRRWYNR